MVRLEVSLLPAGVVSLLAAPCSVFFLPTSACSLFFSVSSVLFPTVISFFYFRYFVPEVETPFGGCCAIHRRLFSPWSLIFSPRHLNARSPFFCLRRFFFQLDPLPPPRPADFAVGSSTTMRPHRQFLFFCVCIFFAPCLSLEPCAHVFSIFLSFAPLLVPPFSLRLSLLSCVCRLPTFPHSAGVGRRMWHTCVAPLYFFRSRGGGLLIISYVPPFTSPPPP